MRWIWEVLVDWWVWWLEELREGFTRLWRTSWGQTFLLCWLLFQVVLILLLLWERSSYVK